MKAAQPKELWVVVLDTVGVMTGRPLRYIKYCTDQKAADEYIDEWVVRRKVRVLISYTKYVSAGEVQR